MARYSVDITANIKGFDELDAIERQIKNIQGYAKKPIDINVKIDTKNADISKQMMSVGKSAASAFAKGFSSSDTSSIDKFAKSKQKYLDVFNDIQKQIAKTTGSSFEKLSVDEKQINKWANEYVNAQQKAFEKLEKEAIKQQNESIKKQQKSRDAYYKNIFDNQFQDRHTKSDTQVAMSEYYTKLEKEAIKQQQKIDKINSEMKSGLFEYRTAKNQSFIDKYVGQDSDALTRARKQIDEINRLQESLKSGNLKGDDFTSTYSKLNDELEKLSYSMKQVGVESSKTLDAGVANASANKVKAYYEENTKAVKKYGDQLKEIEERYRSARTVSDKLDIDRDLKQLQSQISAEGLTGKSRLGEFKRAFGQIAEFAGIYGVIQNVIYEVPRQMIKAVRDVNAAQIELAKVTTASQPELNAYWDEAAESAKRYGSTISDVIKSTADWSRLGYSLDEAKKLSDVTTLLTKVGDNMTQESASQGLISTLKGFQMQADQAESIVDKVNEVANTQPIDTAGIFSGLERSASSMSAANNTLEETIALITAANSVVQDADVVGTAFKSISMRIRGAKTDLEEAGLDTEGMANSTSELRKELKALSGVDIMIDDSTFKSTYDILDELSNKWSELSDIQQANQKTCLYVQKCA